MQKLVVVIPSYKNIQWFKKNLDSVKDQNYEHYRVVYTDDKSPDGTGEAVENYVKEHNLDWKVIRNKNRLGAMRNLYDMIHSCEDDEVVVTLDGDDWLAGPNVLSKVAATYDSGEVWMTWGSYNDHPQNSRGCCRPIPEHIVKTNAYRRNRWMTSHLRTFKAWLFKKIKKEDFYDPTGNFLDVAWDLSFMLPMLEMSGPRGRYIHDILYIYNNENPIQDYKTKQSKQAAMDRFIRNKPKYQRL